MRRLALLVTLIAGTLIGSAAHADNAPQGHVFGAVTCATNIPCGEGGADASLIASQASSCVSQYFNLNGDLFDSSSGLDSSKCLSANSSAGGGSSGGKTRMVPHCCLASASGSDNMCNLVCTEVSVR